MKPLLLFTSLVFSGIATTGTAAELILVAKDTTPAPIIVFKDAPPRTRDAAVKE